MKEKIRYGMVGGGLNAFIGGVHRQAIGLEAKSELVAGCFSRDVTANHECATYFALQSDRTYDDYMTMAKKESIRDDKIDFVSIVTPNFLHYQIAKTFIENKINVVCEKPLCFDVKEALELEKLAKENDVFFAITYSYSGYTMVKQAKKLIEDNYIGRIINVNSEYLQEWLIDDVEEGLSSTKKLSMWRKEPNLAGISNCVGDIGTHIENTVAYITGLKVNKVSAVVDRFEQALDLNANMLVEFNNGAHGVFCCSQVCVGHSNGLVVRIFGTKGSIEWKQEEPDHLYVTKKGEPVQMYNRGMSYITGRASDLNRIPPGHPEGLVIAFANIYKTFMGAIIKKKNGETLTEEDLDFPNASDGVEGVKFIHAVIESDKYNSIWTTLSD